MLKLRHLRLRAITSTATFGTDLQFSPGLNVLQADNTSGKSTCLQAIVFALGLERALGPQLAIPLPYAMRDRIQEHKQGNYQEVLQSFVELEIENGEQQVVTIRRDIVGGANPKLIRTWSGPRLSAASDASQRDFFVHDPGASQREDGFHTFLAKFLGWDLPEVTRFDGGDSPLYLETIFPMVFVEQKRGWSAIQGPFPTFFGIQDLIRRVMEFLLDLDAGHVRRERAEHRRDIALLEHDWKRKISDLKDRVGDSLRFKGIPDAPTAEFAQKGSIELEIFDHGHWKTATAVSTSIRDAIATLEAADVPTSEKIAPELEQELKELKDRSGELIALIETAQHDFRSQSGEKREIEKRISTLETDLARNQDAQKLQKLGSDLGFSLTEQRCPTCHQDVQAELLPTTSTVAMAIDENIAFLKSQLDLYRSTQRSLTAALDQTRANYDAMNTELREMQRRIRELREALIQPSSAPSRARIEEIVQLQAKYDRLGTLQQTVDGVTEELVSLAKRWAELKDKLKKLSHEDFSDDDREKIRDFTETVRRHLERYGFDSFHVNEISLSEDNFRPVVRTKDKDDPDQTVEKELNFEISASDAIRLKWAYYLALMSLARRTRTNHPGIVIFDEPGQQEIEKISFLELLKWSSKTADSQQQTVISTSEVLETVQAAIGGRTANLIHFDDFILKALP